LVYYNELDVKLLSILVASKKDLDAFCSHVGENVFTFDYRKFVKNLFSYYAVYSGCPTLNTLLQHCAPNNSEVAEYLTTVWNQFDENVDIREYSFYLNKINKRYKYELLKEAKSQLQDLNESNIDSKNINLNHITAEISNIDHSDRGYTEIDLKDCVDDWKKQFFAKAKNPELSQGILTGFSMFDYYTNGMKEGLYVIAAQSGHGKSIFLLNVAANCYLGKNVIPENYEDLVAIKTNNAWQKAYNVLYFSLEMPKNEVIDRIISNLASVDSLDIGKGTIKPEQVNNIKKALYYFENSPSHIRIIDMPRDCTMAQIQQIYDNVKTEMQVDLVIIDYLGLMVDSKGDVDQDWQKLLKVSAEMHEFTRVNHVPIFTALQLTITKAGSQAPGMERTGRSKGIMTNVNVALQIEDREDEDLKSDSIIHCVKHRGGPKFIMNNLRKEFQYTRFYDLGFTVNNVSNNQPNMAAPLQQDLQELIREIFGDDDDIDI